MTAAQDALILNNVELAETEAAVAREVIAGFGSDGLHLLVLTGGAHGPALPTETTLNVYTPRPAGTYRNVVIGSRVLLFDGPWAEAFLRYALSLVAPGGRLVVVRAKASARGAHGHWPVSAIRAFAGGDEASGEAGVVVSIPRQESLPAARPSTLSAHLDQRSSLRDALVDYFDTGAVPPDHLAAAARFSHPRFPVRPAALAGDPFRPSDELVVRTTAELGSRSAALARYVAHVNAYMVDGMRYKAPMLAHVVSKAMPGHGAIDLLDVGAAYGLLPAEMLLLDPPAVRTATAVELGYGYTLGARMLVDAFAARLGGRFRFAHATAETFDYADPVDVVSFIGALLYVDKSRLQATLDRCWACLRPGGLLVVQENIRRDTYSSEATSIMFSRPELDALLGRYGSLRYFMSTSATELAADAVGDKSVFRVVVKPS